MIARRMIGLTSWHWAMHAANQKKKITVNFFIIGLMKTVILSYFPTFTIFFQDFLDNPMRWENPARLHFVIAVAGDDSHKNVADCDRLGKHVAMVFGAGNFQIPGRISTCPRSSQPIFPELSATCS